MKIGLFAINAKFSHLSLSILSLYKYLKNNKKNVFLKEFTINNSEDFILNEIYKLNLDVICFSCYIWNIDLILSIVNDIKLISPAIKIVLGGPEVSYEYDYLAKKNIDYIIVGEGEETFSELVNYLVEAEKDNSILNKKFSIKSLAINVNNSFASIEKRELIKLDDINFVYEDGFEMYENKILYYESSRGCPFNCQYCLSSAEFGVRFLSLNRVYSDLSAFLNAKVRQVKFVDRTFNCNKSHALSIWKYLIENDNSTTNFHFEISADLIDDEMIETLKKARIGFFQFEIGIQSTNNDTLSEIKRKTNLEILFQNINKLKQLCNINLHLDLIAGLPFEDYISFRKSFNDVISFYPDQFQLGFLKLLKGSGLRINAEAHNIVYKEKAPYEILFNNNINYSQILELKEIEEIVELYYNSSKFIFSIKYIISKFESPFDFFLLFSKFWQINNNHLVSHNKIKLYEIMFDFCKENNLFDLDKIISLLKFDMLLCDNLKTYPSFILNEEEDLSLLKRDFYNDEFNLSKYIFNYKDYTTKQLLRNTKIEIFNYDIIKYTKDCLINSNCELYLKKQYILFDYNSRLEYAGLSNYHCSFIEIN